MPNVVTSRGSHGRLCKNRENGQRFEQWFFWGASLWWILLGALILLTAFDDYRLDQERILRQADTVFGISVKHAMLAVATY